MTGVELSTTRFLKSSSSWMLMMLALLRGVVVWREAATRYSGWCCVGSTLVAARERTAGEARLSAEPKPTSRRASCLCAMMF